METMQITVIPYHEFDELVAKTFGLEADSFQCVADWEWHNDTSYGPYDIRKPKRGGRDPLAVSRKEAQEARRWLKQGAKRDYWGVGPAQVLGALCYEDALPWGTYLIEVCW